MQAGGVGMVLVDNGAGLVSEVHSVPTVHVTAADGAAIKAYAVAGGSPTAAESAFYFGHQPAPTIAVFSGRGPNLADANILKPDLAAPGVDVIASVTPGLHAGPARRARRRHAGAPGPAWASYDGTSMATPHVTGISLLLKQAHPTWSPAADQVGADDHRLRHARRRPGRHGRTASCPGRRAPASSARTRRSTRAWSTTWARPTTSSTSA